MKRFRVPDYDVYVKPHENLVINTFTFQRLFRLYQLGLAYMVYPFATYTRAAHSIETLNYAQMIVDSLRNNHFPLDESTVDLIRMSALLHDIAHLPFSHTLEDENMIFHEHHDKKKRLEKILGQLKNEIIEPNRKKLSLLEPDTRDRNNALELIDKVKDVLWTISYCNEKDVPSDIKLLDDEFWFVADIVGNTISADLLAYIKRDVEYTGIEKRHGGYRIFDYLKIKEDKDGKKRLAISLTKAGFRIDVFSAILDVLDVRYALMERVVFHHAKCAASGMIAKAARLLDLGETEILYRMGDERFFYHLSQEAEKESIPKKNSEAAQILIGRLNSRIFHKRVYKVTRGERVEYDKSHVDDFCSQFRDSKKSTKFENEVESQFNLPPGSIIIFCPKTDMQLKEAKVMVDWGKPCAYPLNHEYFQEDYQKFWERVNQIEEKYKELWTFYVFIDPDEFGKTAIIQKYIGERLRVKNDPLLVSYLLEKPEYLRSLGFAEIATRVSDNIESDALEGILREAAWDGRAETWDKSAEMAMESAMREYLSGKIDKRKRVAKAEKVQHDKKTQGDLIFSNEKSKPKDEDA